ncbi:hypothetical protein BDK51DRAFT_18663, partial [Blyttiomyces helicus]
GGDGPNYYSTLYALETDTYTWHKIEVPGASPGPRRAHTSWAYNGNLYVHAGGDGVRALNDVYVLNTRDAALPFNGGAGSQPDAPPLAWTKLHTSGTPPSPRGYHTSNLISGGPKLVVYGGSDGHECFSDVHVLDLNTRHWTPITLDRACPRLSHTATQVGSYLFVLGGHDGARYSGEVLLLNLVTMNWETRRCFGGPPRGRGYHAAVLHDSRVFVYGGYDGAEVFGEMWTLDLSACGYLPQITAFEVGEEGMT